MSRFFLTDAPALAPGVCWITKTGVGPFIDTGVDLSKNVIDRGRIYISVDALREMAQIAGLFEEKEPISAELRRKEWYDKGYNDAVKELQNDVVNNFVERVLSSSTVTAGAAIPESSASSEGTTGQTVGIAEESAGDKPQVNKNTGGTKRKGSSTGSVKRPASLSASSSDESTYRL
jgi:hypothetical protein